MAAKNPQRFELGEMLRVLREGVGMKPKAVERELRWYAGKVSRVEGGTRVPVPAEVDKLADLFSVLSDERETLHLLADAARKREPPARVADFAQTYVTLERAANTILYYDAELIPSLLQTERYARAVLATGSGMVDEMVADRIARQSVLTREHPPTVRVMLGEAALYREVGGANAMRDQLQHLITIGRLPNVSIRIVPFAVGAHRAIGVGFTFVRIGSPTITRVYIEGLTSATYIHEPDETERYEKGFTQVWAAAASEAESATILRARIAS